MPELFLDIACVDLSGTDKAGTQRVAREQRQTFLFGQFGSDACVQHCALDQTCDMLVVEPRFGGPFAIA